MSQDIQKMRANREQRWEVVQGQNNLLRARGQGIIREPSMEQISERSYNYEEGRSNLEAKRRSNLF
jgi:adenylosuccinate lyase